MIEWEVSVDAATKKYTLNPSHENLYALLLEEFGLLYSTTKKKEEDLFDRFSAIALEHCETLIDKEYKIAEVKAIKSSITGLKIAYSPWKGMFLGPRASILINEAINTNPESALVQHLYANQQNFTPKMWGGSIANAANAYQRAIELYEEDNQTNCWLYLDAHAWFGLVQEELGNDEKAKQVWEYIVEVSPEFTWVKDQLLMGLQDSYD